MFKIVGKQVLALGIKEIDIQAGDLVKKYQAGNFFQLFIHPDSLGLSISNFDVDQRRGVISLVFEDHVEAFQELAELKIGDTLHAVAGPYGQPLEEMKKKTVICAATGLYLPAILPVTRFYKNLGCKVIAVVEANNKKEIVFESKLRVNCQKIILGTIDGSYQRKAGLDELMKDATAKRVHFCYGVGPRGFIRDLSVLTEEAKFETVVNMLPGIAKFFPLLDTTYLEVSRQPIYPFVDGLNFNTKTIDLTQWTKLIQGFQEYKKCRTLPLKPSQPKKEPGIFPKLLSGLTKEKP